MAPRLFSLAGALGLASIVDAHSWVHCSDYRGNTRYYEEDKCFGHPRVINNQVPAMFQLGQDIGYDEQTPEIAPGVSQCHTSRTDPLPGYPRARYRQGQIVTLAWPTKNHVAATCTNPDIPDTKWELFIADFDPNPTTYTQVQASFSDKPHEKGKIDFQGFQNCPAFCENMDKSLCTGTFTVPENIPDGVYTFQWKWEFNADTAPYVTCFEAYVGQDVTIPTSRPTMEGETMAPTVPVTPAPTENADCVGLYAQCGGGNSASTCCHSGSTCFRQSEYYSQCLTACPAGWECDSSTPAPISAPVPTPTPAPITPSTPAPSMGEITTCQEGFGYYGKLKKAVGKATVEATLENGCDCAKFCTIFAPNSVQFLWTVKNGKCVCFSEAGKFSKSNAKKTFAGSLPLAGYTARFEL